jgi:hypothetical protein
MGSTVPTVKVNEEVAFKPVAASSASLAGKIPTVVTFTTDNHSGATAATDKVTLNRIVPEEWTFLGYSLTGSSATAFPTTSTYLTVTSAGATVWLHAKTNTGWYGLVNADVVTTPVLTAAEANSTRAMVIPGLDPTKNTSWEDYSSANLDTKIQYGYKLNASNKPDPGANDYFHARQTPYTLYVTYEPATYNSVYLNVSTNAPTFYLDVINEGGWTVSDQLSKTTGGRYGVNLERHYNISTPQQLKVINAKTGAVKCSFTQPGTDYRLYPVSVSGYGPSSFACPAGWVEADMEISYGETIRAWDGSTLTGAEYPVRWTGRLEGDIVTRIFQLKYSTFSDYVSGRANPFHLETWDTYPYPAYLICRKL